MAVEFSTVDTLQAALTYHRERHTVLAGNVANLDTPGYRPVDLNRDHRGRRADPRGDRADGHIATPPAARPYTGVRSMTVARCRAPDGNAVSLERELAKIDANRARYSTSAELVSRRLAMLRYAAGDGT